MHAIKSTKVNFQLFSCVVLKAEMQNKFHLCSVIYSPMCFATPSSPPSQGISFSDSTKKWRWI